MPMKKPAKRTTPPPKATAKHPMQQPGMRWIETIAHSPANLLQLQRTTGNQAVAKLLQRFADPTRSDGLAALKTYRAARRDGLAPPPGVDGAELMATQDPHYGDWHFQFVADPRTGDTAFYWITLRQYKNRERHVLIDAATQQPIELLGGDLDERERKLLGEWALQMFHEQVGERIQTPPSPPAGTPAPKEEEEEDFLGALLADDGGDEGNGLGLGAVIAAADAAKGGAGTTGKGGKGNRGGTPKG
ncbi:hypothetical protein MO973_11820 [Paenibacillus sp. TRM 82003]|nr:hypothetical protein [Paenibacillus sp. TRM 82003]